MRRLTGVCVVHIISKSNGPRIPFRTCLCWYGYALGSQSDSDPGIALRWHHGSGVQNEHEHFLLSRGEHAKVLFYKGFTDELVVLMVSSIVQHH